MPMMPPADPTPGSLRKELNQMQRDQRNSSQQSRKASTKVGNATPQPVRPGGTGQPGHPGTSDQASRADHTHRTLMPWEAIFSFAGEIRSGALQSPPYRITIPARIKKVWVTLPNTSDHPTISLYINGKLVARAAGDSADLDVPLQAGDRLTVAASGGSDVTVQVIFGE